MLPQNTGSNEEEEEKPSSSKEIVPVKLSEDNKIDEQTKAELLVLMQRYLAASCPEAAEVLKNELEKKNIIPPRYDITGQSRKRSFEEYVRLIPQAQPNLMDLMSHLNSLTNKYVPPVLPKLPLRIINSKRQSLTRNTESVKKLPVIEDILTQRPSLSGFQSLDCLKMLTAREMGTQLSSRLLLRKDCINNLDLHARILGHLSAVFCVAFDRTGRYIITGADDNLIKIWDAHKGILRCTLRGHAGEISDITVSHENTVLATGSTDKTVRVWCLQTGRVLQIYHCHTGTITSIAFLPYMVDEHRFLVSTGSDCRVCFYKWNGPKKEFPTIPYLFDERVTSGSRIVSSCHSPGGNLVVIGDTHHYIRIYQILEDNIEKIFEYHAHTDRVDSLVWSHSHLRFVSGSKDGTAKVWKFAAGHWTSVNLYPFLKIEEPARVRHPRLAPNGRGGLELTYTAPVPVQPTTNKKNSYKVTMLCWSLEDDFVISSGTDYVIRVWNWETGQVIKEMLGHENDAFVLTAHPIYKEFIFSAGHDGFVIVWDIYKGVAVKKNINTDAIGNDPIFDLCVSSDGTLVAFVDSQGHLSILGVGRNDRIRSYPKQQFFHTDYKPLFTDHNHYVVDADTGLAPHLMDPPIFCNADTIPHEQIFQRMIPGNDVIETNITQTLENSQSQSENPNIQELLSIGRTQSRCPWITRDIIQSYRESQLNKIYDERNCTTEEERKEFEKEKEKYDPEIEQRVLQSSQAAQSQRNQRGRGRPGTARTGISVRDIDQLFERLNQPVGRGRNRSLVDPIGQLSDPEDDNYTEHSHSGEDDSSEDETEDGDGQQDRGHLEEDDSDYEVGRPESSTVFRSRSNFTVTGRRKSRRNRNPEDSGPSSQQSTHHTSPRRRRSRVQPSRAQRSRRPREEQTSPERSRRSEGTKRTRDRSEKSTERKRIKAEKVEFDDPDLFTQSDPDVPSTSSGRAHRALARKSSQSGDEIKKTSKRHQAKKEPSSAHGPIIDFPMWMRKVQVRRFPYIAQLGDQVVYCLQGHQAYLNAVEEQRIYRIPREFDIRSDLNAEEFCIVDELEYRLKPYRTIVLKLAITDANGRRKKGEYINVMYHDMEGQPDFLILKQHYDLSLSYSFDSGSAVEAMIDDIWWVGRIQNRVPFDEDYPMSNWMSLVVRWDTGEDLDLYCPWDLQPKKNNRKTNTRATQKELEQLGSYKPVDGDWPKFEDDQSNEETREHYLKRAQKAISQLFPLTQVEPFKEPVNLNEFEDYPRVISYPSDLQIIGERINNKFYRRLVALLQDIQYIAINTESYNDESAQIVHNSITLVETLVQFITQVNHENAANLYETLWDQDSSEFKSYRMKLKPYNKKEFLNQPSSSKASYSSIQPRRTEAVWISECREIMEKILNQDFRDKIHRLERTGLFEEEDTFDQLVEKLNNGEYNSPMDFEHAVIALVEACKNSVDDVRSSINKALLTFQSQFKVHMKQVTTKYTKMTEVPSSRSQRAAAQHAAELWRNPDFQGPSTSKALRERKRQQTRYNTRKRDGTEISYREDPDD